MYTILGENRYIEIVFKNNSGYLIYDKKDNTIDEFLRTGYIEEQSINLSPRRKNSGYAYLEYVFDKPIYKFKMDISYWQIKDLLDPKNSSATISVLNENNEWILQSDLLTEFNLSTDHTNPSKYEFHNINRNEIFGIRVDVTSPATGNNNSGRISVGFAKLISYKD